MIYPLIFLNPNDFLPNAKRPTPIWCRAFDKIYSKLKFSCWKESYSVFFVGSVIPLRRLGIILDNFEVM